MANFDDETVQAVLALRAQGWTQQAIATKLGISRSSVSRILADGPRVPDESGERVREVRAMADRLELANPITRARYGLALTLAVKLDQAEKQTTASSGHSAATLGAQFRATLAELAPEEAGNFERLVAALTGDIDGEAERYRAALTVIAAGRSDGSKDWAKPRHTAEEMRAIAVEALGGAA
jgi:transcriptional regulator with XRE-family HTH domain